ncbi:MAG: phosphatase PAP2 family protein [Bacteroidia bacterium]|nr:phosphatase PAP2 family protein [Bacteroidia bacterium]
MKHIIFFLLIVTYINIVRSQDSTIILADKARINLQYLKSYYLDTKDILISPVKWKPKNWLIAGSVVCASAILTTQDERIRDYFQSQRTETSDLITKHGFERFGSGVYTMPAMGLFYLHGLTFKNERSKKVALLGVKTYLLSGLIVTIPKFMINRHRPFHDTPPNANIWVGPSLKHWYWSMPSGHTTSIFAVVTIVASEYSDKIYIPIIAYTIAALTGLSRIHDDKHWASDVVAGAALGFGIAKLIYNRNNWKIKSFKKI